MVVEKDRVSHILLLCGAAIWGVNFVAMKFLLAEIAPVNLILVTIHIGKHSFISFTLFYGRCKGAPERFL